MGGKTRLRLSFADAKRLTGQSVLLEARWQDLFRKSGLPKIRPHDLSHTHASLLLKAGRHPKAVSEWLGHSSIMITLDRYSHLFPTLQQEAAEKIDELLTIKLESTERLI
ncbi:tyrosine-type recombinase/integrase [Cohnella sp. GCM10020058]|uniref:tyrosine-type recombinase/integrase n=1 Tax=Cohnella sp. GCM10020058 TaxID=3317330 RepID=UPI003645F4ED